jgi:hypothetical protein
MSDATSSAIAFAAIEALRDGSLDDHLEQLNAAINERQRLYDMSRPPPRTATMIEQHQVWAGMNGPGRPHWEVRGTGAIWPSD